MKKKYIMALLLSQIIIIVFTILFFNKYNKYTEEYKILQYSILIFTILCTVFFMIDIFHVIIKKLKFGRMIIKLGMSTNSKETFRIVPLILMVFGLLNLAVGKNIFIISLSTICIFFSVFCMIRAFVPYGIMEKGVLIFGETFNWSSIKECCINNKESCIEFTINKGNIKDKLVKLQLEDSNYESVIEYLNKINVQLKVNH